MKQKQKRFAMEEQIKRILLFTMLPMALLIAFLLVASAGYVSRYNQLAQNLSISSEFNLHFKDDLDVGMYYIAIFSEDTSHLSEVMALVDEAENTIAKLEDNTYNADSRKSLKRLKSYLTNLRKRMQELTEEEKYDARMQSMDSNIRVLTSLVVQEMQNYIYTESMYLVSAENALTRHLYVLIGTVALLCVAELVILIRRSFRFSHNISEPVKGILNNVREVGLGNFQIAEVQADNMEIEELDAGIRMMAKKIEELLANVRKEEEMKHLIQLQLLQAQVNPHFLYNTLDTIIWLIEGGQTEDAVEMISSLSVFFRTSLSKGEDIIPLSEEKRHTLSYLEIQQSRYRDILEFEIRIPDEFNKIMVPKLTLQPLAENALYHGIKNKRGGGRIVIEGFDDGDGLILRVTDNGQGMTEKRLREIRRAIQTGERAGFGLAAVAERIRLYYGPEYGIKIDSEEGKGTTIEVRLAKKITTVR